MITIRQERVTDYATIGELHAQAFGNRAVEATIVALLRQRRAFDPELSLVTEIDGKVIGHVKEPTRPRVFLASDHEAAWAIVTTMARKSKSALHETGYILPLHPFSASVKAFGHANCIAQKASMACSLGPSPLNDYLALVQSGQRPPGRVTWHTSFDLE